MSAEVKILYHETKGNITEERDVVLVTLTRWETDGDYRNYSHYTLRKMVVVDGETISDSTRWMPAYWNTDPSAIRQAIAEFDSLVEAHPTLGKE
jgi:hypothetical protein